MTLDVRRVDWEPGKAIDLVDRLGREANEAAGHRLLELASDRIPTDTGELEASGELNLDDDGVAVGYGAEHARYVHAHPEWSFQDGRSGHWLEETAERDAGELGDIYASTIRSGWPG